MKTKNLKRLGELLDNTKIDYMKSILAIVKNHSYDICEETSEVSLYDIYESIFNKIVDNASGGAVKYIGPDFVQLSTSDILIMVNKNTSKITRYIPNQDTNKLIDVSVKVKDSEEGAVEISASVSFTDDYTLNDIIDDIRTYILDICKYLPELLKSENALDIITNNVNVLNKLVYDVFIRYSDELTEDSLDRLRDCMNDTVLHLAKLIMPDVDKTVTAKKAAEILGCSVKEARAIIGSGVIEAHKIKGCWEVDFVSLLKFKYNIGGNM